MYYMQSNITFVNSIIELSDFQAADTTFLQTWV